MKRLSILLILIALIDQTRGQELRLNEFYPGDQGLKPNYALTGHWIELFNDSDSLLQTDIYSLRIKNNSAQVVPDPADVKPGSFLVVPLDISVRVGDVLQLYRSDSVLVDSLNVVNLEPFQSVARVPDGSGPWHVVNRNSRGEPNYPDFPDSNVILDDWIKYGNAPFTIRDGAGAIVFNGYMWILSGWEHGPLSQEVWRTKNGLDWEFVTLAPWQGRHQAGFVVFDNRMWVISGDLIPDVWSSADGIQWDLVTDNAPWGQRYAPYVVVYDGRIWLMGGINYPLTPEGTYDFDNPNQFNDVWSTTNGKDWTLATDHAAWAPRSMILGSVVFDNKMWILGGGVKGYSTTLSEYNDVWNSTDGVTWTLVTDSAGWDPRIHMSTIVYDQRIWVTDGSPGEPWVLTNEVWSSVDGAHWDKQETPSRWSARHATSLFNFDGSLWIIAGFNNNDVWRYTAPPKVFYSKSAGDITDPQTWGTLPDGSGTAPASFSEADQILVLANRDSVTLGQDLAITGTGSKLLVGDQGSGLVLDVPEHVHLDATVEVGAGSSLVLRSPEFPRLAKLGMNSTVAFRTGSEFELPAGGYYNLEIQSPGKVSSSGDVAVYGALTCLSGNLTVDSLSPVRLYGDLFVASGASVENARVRLLGTEDQQLVATDTLVLATVKVHKTRGEIRFAAPTDIRRSFVARLNDSTTMWISAALGLSTHAVLEGDTAEVSIPGEVTLRQGAFRFNRVQFARLSFERRDGQVRLDSSDFAVENVNVYSEVANIADGAATRVTVGRSIDIDNASEGDVSFGELTLRLEGPEDVAVSSSTPDTVRLANLELALSGGGTLNLSASVKILGEAVLYSGKINPVHPFRLTGSDTLLLRFAGSTPQTLADFSADSLVSVHHAVIMNPLGVSLTTDMKADTISLVEGDLYNLTRKLYVNRIRSFNATNSIVINDGGTVITYASREPNFLPLAFDSVMLPIEIKANEPDPVTVSIKLQRVNIQGAMRYGWLIENLSHPDKVLEVTLFWPKEISPANQNPEDTEISLVSSFNYEIHETQALGEPSPDFFAKMGSLTISQALVLINQHKREALPEFDISLFPNPSSGTVNVTLFRTTPGHVRLSLFSAQGSLLTTQELALAPGQQILRMMDLPPGLYILKVDDGDVPRTIKFTVL